MNHENNRDEAWRQLSDAGHVQEADPEVLRSAYAEYLASLAEDGGKKPLPMTRSRRRPVLMAAAAAAIVGGALLPALVGDGGVVNEDTTVGAASPGKSLGSSLGATSVEPSPAKPTTTVNVADSGGSLVAYFGAPTFEAFTDTPYVSEVVEGTIERATSRVVRSRDDGSIVTELRVQVTRAREGEAGVTITVLEPGGVVAKSDMKEELERKFGKLSEADLSGYVEERYNGQPAARVGDRVLLAIGNESDRVGPMVVAKLVLSEDSYSWEIPPPNPDWPVALDSAQVDRLFA